jgi:hypothetical protein
MSKINMNHLIISNSGYNDMGNNRSQSTKESLPETGAPRNGTNLMVDPLQSLDSYRSLR